jgi:HEAT repeat protein
MNTSLATTIAELVAQMPDVDDPGKASKFTGPPPEAAADLYEEILKGNRKAMRELIKMVRAPADPDFHDFRAAYVLHGLAMHLGAADKQVERRHLTMALADASDDSAIGLETRALLIRELQYAGGADAVKALSKRLADERLCEPATQALLAIGGKAAYERLATALRSSRGPNRTTIVQALGASRDPGSVKLLLPVVHDPDRETRLAAAWALANSGSPDAITALLDLAEQAQGWERIQATNACLLLAERLLESKKKPDAARIYKQLRDTRKDPAERHIREAAERALEKLA